MSQPDVLTTPISEDGPSHAVVLVTEDGIESTLACAETSTILDAAAEAGCVLPSACKAGGCGACTATLASGQILADEHDPEVVDPPEEEGGILLCSSRPLSDCRIELPYGREKVASTPPARRTATVVSVDHVSEGTARLRLRLIPGPDGAASAEFQAGQFVTMTVPGTSLRRSYSMANVANWDGDLEFFIRVLPTGAMSEYLRERAAVGDEISLEGPKGTFELRENGFRPRFFVAGGTGLSPLLAMLRRMAEWGDLQPARLFHGVNTAAQVFATADIQDLESRLLDFTSTVSVWEPSPTCPDQHSSPVDAALEALGGCAEMPDVYLCGPPAMIQAASRALSDAGVPAEQIYSEIFAPS